MPINGDGQFCRFGSFGALELVLAPSGDHLLARATHRSCGGWGHDRGGERVPSPASHYPTEFAVSRSPVSGETDSCFSGSIPSTRR